MDRIKDTLCGVIGFILGTVSYVAFYYFNGFFTKTTCLIGLYFLSITWYRAGIKSKHNVNTINDNNRKDDRTKNAS